MFYTSTLAPAAAAPASNWYRYLFLGLMVTALAWLSGRYMPPVWLAGLSRAWLLISATLGMVLAGLWFLTDHAASSHNVNLLLLNPLLLLALVPRLQRFGAALLVGGNVLAFFLLFLPTRQYNLDVIALLGPINLAVGLYLLRAQHKESYSTS
jgi:hypothetical protein